jgi:hypothetical protein
MGGRLVETLPALQHDPNRSKEVLKVDADEDGVGGDDAGDTFRYLVAKKGRTIIQRKLRGLQLAYGCWFRGEGSRGCRGRRVKGHVGGPNVTNDVLGGYRWVARWREKLQNTAMR